MSNTEKNLLDPGFELTLRPMRYPDFYERYRDAIKNTWTVEEVDLHSDVADLAKLSPGEQHMIGRLVAFFATGDSIVSNNLVLTLYKHINSPEARLYLSRQLFEEAVHVQFYLTLLDTYLPDPDDRAAAFDAVEEIPSIREKAQFCFKWMDSVEKIERLETKADRRRFLLNLICFAACIEGLFFYGAFAYVYWFRSRGLLHGLATGTNWVFRDETMHMNFAFEVVDTVRKEEPDLFDDELQQQVTDMLKEAVDGGAAVRPRPVRRRSAGHEHRVDARVPGVRGRPAAPPARLRRRSTAREPVLVHGVAGCPGADELLRAPPVGVPGGGRGHGRLRRRLLIAPSGRLSFAISRRTARRDQSSPRSTTSMNAGSKGAFRGRPLGRGWTTISLTTAETAPLLRLVSNNIQRSRVNPARRFSSASRARNCSRSRSMSWMSSRIRPPG